MSMDLPGADCGISPLSVQHKYVRKALPVIISQLAKDWPLRHECTLEALRYVHGDTKVNVKEASGTWKLMALRSYIDGFQDYQAADVKPYLRTWNFLEDIPHLAHLFKPPQHFQDAFQQLPENLRPPFTWLFVGPKGAETRLHVDIWHTDAWLAQLQGCKRFRLFHPSRREQLVSNGLLDNEPSESHNGTGQQQQTCKQAFCNACSEIPHGTVVLQPGDVIYIPRGWPHQAEALDDGVSLTSNFLSEAACKHVLPHLEAYVHRRQSCEQILGRRLRAGDNLMKFCCHGGRLPSSIASHALIGVSEHKQIGQTGAELLAA